MNLKKKIPLTVLELLEPYLQKGNEKVRLINPGIFLLKFIDVEDSSDFYFNIEQSQFVGGILKLLIDRKPESKDAIENYRTWVDAKILKNYFTEWVAFIENYEQIKSIYDDPIEKKYQEEFYSEFEILDEDSEINSFNLDQQIWIDSYLEKVILALDNHKEEEEDSQEIQDIRTIAQQLRTDLTKLTKKPIVQKLSWIWSKARKHGLVILKEIYVEFKSELIKQLIQAQLPK